MISVRMRPPSGFPDLLRLIAGGASPLKSTPVEVFEQARLHHVAGLTARKLLATAPEQLSPSLRRTLEDVLTSQARVAAAVLALADEVQAAIAREAVPCVVFKGAGLFHGAYESLADRSIGDLDVLVPRDRLERAEAVLSRLGFREAFAPRTREFFLRHHFHVPWRAPSGIVTDLHWSVVGPRSAFRPDLPGILARAGERRPRRSGPACPVPADALLLMSLQHQQEGFSDLRRAVDADRLARLMSPEDWDLLVRHATSSGMGALVAVYLLTSRNLLGTTVPAWVSASLYPGGFQGFALRRLRLEEMVARRMAAEVPAVKWLVHCWTAPDPAARRRVVRDLLLVEPGYWEDTFFVPRAAVPLSKRLIVRLGRWRTAAKLIAYEAWLLAGRPSRFDLGLYAGEHLEPLSLDRDRGTRKQNP